MIWATVAALLTCSVTLISWGGLRPAAVYHDESAYLLQASIFARGDWVASSPELPEFFEQYHVLVTPVLAAKYPPGHSLMLVPGVWVDLRGLVPVALAGVTAAMLVLVVSREFGLGAAVLAWLFWLMAPLALRFRPTFLSETTTAAAWVVGLWFLSRWWAHGRVGSLVGLAATAGWMAVTRPWTALAYVLPLSFVVIPRLVRQRRVRDFGALAIVFTGIVALLPLWAHMTTGSWSRTPLAVYKSQYMPWDRLGFGLDTASAQRNGPPDIEQFSGEYRRLHTDHTAASLAWHVAARVASIWSNVWGAGALLALVAAVIGIRLWNGPVLVGVAQVLMLVCLYSLYAHSNDWNAYYLSAVPLICILPAIGLTSIGRCGPSMVRGTRAVTVAGAFAIIGLVAANSLAELRGLQQRVSRAERLSTAAKRVDVPALVFVRRTATHSVHEQLVSNTAPNPPVLLAHDLGVRNGLLIAASPGRTAYLYDESTGVLTRLKD